MRATVAVDRPHVASVLFFEEAELAFQLLPLARRARNAALELALIRPQTRNEPPHQSSFAVVGIQKLQRVALILLVLFDLPLVLADLFAD